MDNGDKVICQSDNWVNAYGEATTVLHTGMRLTVCGKWRIGGATFLEFNETPKGCVFWSAGFVPLRSLN